MRKTMLLMVAALSTLAASATYGADKAALPPDHGVFAPGDIKWGDAPAILPAGARIAVLKGDPSKEGIFVLRLKVPSDYRIMPHWHPAYENVTVISGTANIGMGEVFDKTKGVKIPTGGFGYLAPQMHHFFWAEGETVIQLHGMGPWQLYYLNPDDDPRRMAAQK
jgi:hypothetical protein